MSNGTYLEKAIPSVLTAAIVAFATMTYQFAQMRTEILYLGAAQSRLDAKVEMLMGRLAYFHGAPAPAEVADTASDKLRLAAELLAASRVLPLIGGKKP